MDILQSGIQQGLLQFDADEKFVTYIHANKKYRYTDPEEKVRAATYVRLITEFNYKPEHIGLEVLMPDRVPNNYADIVVYNDNKKKDPYIVIECKSAEVSDAEFKQAIEQGFAYAAVLSVQYLWVTSSLNDRFFNVKDFPKSEREENEIPIIPEYGKKESKDPTYILGGEGIRALKELTESELTTIFKKAHDSLWYGGKRNPSEAFDELNKLIFCKIYDEKITEEERPQGTPYRFQNYPSDEGNAEILSRRIKSIYEDGRQHDPEVFKDDIRISPQELRTIVGFLAKINLRDTDMDSKGRAFEVFLKDDIFRGRFGQYFTPRNIVKFVVDVLPIDAKSTVLDPSCGSGGFLLYALDKVRKIADEKFPDRKGKKNYKYWHDFAENNLFGIEISETIARVAKMNMIIHDDGHTNVIAFDGLESIEKIHAHALKNKSRSYSTFDKGKFDYVITNPPFGSVVKESERGYLGDYDLGKKNYDWIDSYLKSPNLELLKDNQQSEILFIEQYFEFLRFPESNLREGGMAAVVIPDGILTNSSAQYVRDWIEENFRILAVVSLPQHTFTATGAGVKSSLLFLQKYNDKAVEAIRSRKKSLQESLFNDPEQGGEILRLIKEKEYTINKGNDVIQSMNENLVNLLESLRNQENSSPAEIKKLQKATQEKIKEHQKTQEYKDWLKTINEDYNERIENAKEAMRDAFAERIATDNTQNPALKNYPVFMAIAEDIGYDATGRETSKNDLPEIAKELRSFIEAVRKGDEDFFV